MVKPNLWVTHVECESIGNEHTPPDDDKCHNRANSWLRLIEPGRPNWVIAVCPTCRVEMLAGGEFARIYRGEENPYREGVEA